MGVDAHDLSEDLFGSLGRARRRAVIRLEDLGKDRARLRGSRSDLGPAERIARRRTGVLTLLLLLRRGEGASSLLSRAFDETEYRETGTVEVVE